MTLPNETRILVLQGGVSLEVRGREVAIGGGCIQLRACAVGGQLVVLWIELCKHLPCLHALAELCLAELRKTALDADGAAALNRRLAEVWPDLRTEIGAQAITVAEMAQALRAAGGPLSGEDLGLPRKVWRDAVRCAREIRGRWSFLNLAADAGLLEPFLEERC